MLQLFLILQVRVARLLEDSFLLFSEVLVLSISLTYLILLILEVFRYHLDLEIVFVQA